ncbi:MAG: LacI family DNA-binding transcriptional regulator [Acidobacteria bacterium]|nr:LacI family DNA-binding transcriptional regulator [Acidobacteriota bacterium]
MASRLKDIAEHLGVSVITVSKVLRDHPDISAETRARVWKRVREVNYRPNIAARALVTGKSMSVGFIAPDLMHAFFSEVAGGLSRVLRTKGYGLLISSSEEDTGLEQQEVSQMLARGVDALVIASAQSSVESLREIEDRKVPYILIDRKLDTPGASFVGTDDETAGRMATEHLIEKGCRRIAHIRGANVSTAEGRCAGYRAALAKHGMTMPEDYIVYQGVSDNSGEVRGHSAMRQLLTRDPRPDGVFCFNDPGAMGAMIAILEAGLRIPEDIALIGCGNVRYAPFLRVPLSTVDQSAVALGEQAGRLALAHIEAKTPSQPTTVLLEPKLVERASTARLL